MGEDNKQISLEQGEHPLKVVVLTRGTYESRKSNNEIKDNELYFVKENTTTSSNLLSLYIGLAKQTDLVSINDIIGYNNIEFALNHKLTEDDLMKYVAEVDDKIMYYINPNLNVVELYMYSKEVDRFIPLAGNISWEEF